jgi:hypothetical protein
MKSPSLMIWKEASRRIAWNEVALSDDLERSVTSDRWNEVALSDDLQRRRPLSDGREKVALFDDLERSVTSDRLE